jgi:hypothetical protein
MTIAQASKTRIENPPVIGRFSGIQTRCQHRSSATGQVSNGIGVEFTRREWDSNPVRWIVQRFIECARRRPRYRIPPASDSRFLWRGSPPSVGDGSLVGSNEPCLHATRALLPCLAPDQTWTKVDAAPWFAQQPVYVMKICSRLYPESGVSPLA